MNFLEKDPAECVEVGPAEHGECQAEEFTEAVGVSALSNQEVI